jgi:hypothetical protein
MVLSVTTVPVPLLVLQVHLVSLVPNVVYQLPVSPESVLHCHPAQSATPKNSVVFATHSIKSATVPVLKETVPVLLMLPTQ